MPQLINMRVDPARQQGPGMLSWADGLGMPSYQAKPGKRGGHLEEFEQRSDVSGIGGTHQKRGKRRLGHWRRSDSQECEV